ncbi:hypothetical protein GCM10009504_09060 [Pseudomonas laurentiana]|nr:hypothetical protein GCM10009504_09060 [Pseudomonas laurentiana]
MLRWYPVQRLHWPIPVTGRGKEVVREIRTAARTMTIQVVMETKGRIQAATGIMVPASIG